MKLPRLLRLGLLFLGCAVGAWAADFEGVITWTFRSEVTDPALKARLAETRRELRDPKKLAQLKGALSDPQMQAAFAHNPQLKSALEAQIRLAEAPAGADPLAGIVPSKMIYRKKSGRTQFVMQGGPAGFELIDRASPRESLLVDRAARTFARAPLPPAQGEAGTPKYEITKLAGGLILHGYTCTPYRIVLPPDPREENAQPTRVNLWATKDLPGLGADALSRAHFGDGFGNALFLSAVDGLPLRMEIETPQMKLRLDATEVKRGAEPDEHFTVPAGFREVSYAAPGDGGASSPSDAMPAGLPPSAASGQR